MYSSVPEGRFNTPTTESTGWDRRLRLRIKIPVLIGINSTSTSLFNPNRLRISFGMVICPRSDIFILSSSDFHTCIIIPYTTAKINPLGYRVAWVTRAIWVSWVCQVPCGSPCPCALGFLLLVCLAPLILRLALLLIAASRELLDMKRCSSNLTIQDPTPLPQTFSPTLAPASGGARASGSSRRELQTSPCGTIDSKRYELFSPCFRVR